MLGLTFVKGNSSSQAQCAEIWDVLFSKGSDLPISDFQQASHLSCLLSVGGLGNLLSVSMTVAEGMEVPPIPMSVGLI